MASQFRCVQGHHWEDAFGGPSLAEGEVRCPHCGFPSFVCKPTTDLAGHTEAYPALPSNSGPTTAALPQPSGVPATVVRSGLANMPAEDIESAPPVLPSRRMPRSRVSDTAPRPDPSTSRPAPNIPGYEILCELGRGGMGVVYKARQLGLNRLVAIKMIIAGSAADERERARFRTEAEAIARLQHPNIVQIFEVNELDGSPWFSLEYVDGGSLADRLKGEPLAVNEAARLIEVLAAAMHFAHEHDVVHRDLKPANVLLQREEHSSKTVKDSLASAERKKVSDPSLVSARVVPKITDFGLAKTLDEDIHHTRSGMVVGTPSYMAPEQATRGTTIGPPSDIYSLGVILYQLVTGRLPFLGDTPMEIMIKVTQEEAPRPTRFLPKLPRDLETVILKCLEKEPRRRYATAGELSDDLKRFLAHEPILARPVGKVELLVRWVRRRRAMTALVAAATLTVLSLVGTLGVLAHGEQRRLAGVRKVVETALTRAQEKARAKEWAAVPSEIGGNLTVAREEPSLAPLVNKIQDLLTEAEGQANARKMFAEFTKARTAAVFRAAQESGTSTRAELEQTRRSLDEALGIVGASAKEPPPRNNTYTDAEWSEISTGCYELLLLLADLSARNPSDKAKPEKGNIEEALAILDTAAKLELPTRAFHLRRARLLKAASRFSEEASERKLAARPPSGDLDHYLAGLEYLRENKLVEAEASFDSALRYRPDHFWARYFLALCHIYNDNLTAARDNLTACLAQRNEMRILLLRAFVLGQLGRDADAERDFKAAKAGLDPSVDKDTLYTLLNNRAVTRLGLDKFDDAMGDLQEAIRLVPEGYHAYVTMAEVLAAQDQTNEALAAMGLAIGRAAALRQRDLLDAGTLTRLHQMRYWMHLKAKDPASAKKDLDEVFRLGLQGLPVESQARLLREMGHTRLRANQLKEALASYDQAAKLDPNNPELQRWRGEVLLRDNKPDQAITAFNRYLALGGKPNGQVLSGRALSLMHRKDYERAALAFTQALDASPEDTRLLEHRARAYLACKAWDLAVKDFNTSLARKPTAEGYEGRGQALLRLEKLREAVMDFDEVIARKPSAGAYHGRGQALLRLERPREASRDAELMAELARGDAGKLYSAALLLAQAAGQFESRGERARFQSRALELLDQAMKARPAGERPAFWRDKVDTQPSLRALRERPEFAALERRHTSPRERP